MPNQQASITRLSCRHAYIDGAFSAATVTIEGGVITEIEPGIDPEAQLPDDTVLLPGLIDTHVHVNEPGRTQWEGFATATAAAASGGIATIIDMPLNSLPATTTPAALAAKRAAAAPKALVNIGFWGGAVPSNLGRLAELQREGVFGFKAFLSPSGIDDFPELSAAQFDAAAREIADFDGLLIVHAEDPALLRPHAALGRRYRDYLATRPPESERSAVAQVIETARTTGARVHILHLSDASSLPELRRAKKEGVRITVETCPHYLALSAEEVPDGAPEFKCCPPIRAGANQDLLWQGVLDGTIDTIGSDHSPNSVAAKRAGDGDFGLAWGGVSGLEVGFQASWTAARARGVPLERVTELYTTGPARLLRLPHGGVLSVGAPADLTVIAPERRFTVDAGTLHHRHPISAYHGRTLNGPAVATVVNGVLVHGEVGAEPSPDHRTASQGFPGRLLERP